MCVTHNAPRQQFRIGVYNNKRQLYKWVISTNTIN